MNTRNNTPLAQHLTHAVAPAVATPLADDGVTVDTAALPALLDLLLAAGAGGLFVGGTTGEGILLAAAERERLHEAAVALAGARAPVLLHVGANDLPTAQRLARQAAALKPAAIAAVTPTYYPMPDDALFAYYAAIAAAAPGVPLLGYDIPHMAVNGIGPALLERLQAEIPAFCGVKTSRPDVQVVRQLLAAAGPNCLVLAGNERAALGLLALGADGLISGLATAVPELFVGLTAAFGAGDMAAARVWQTKINQALDSLPGAYRIGVIKTILAQRGVPVGPPLPPRPRPPAGNYWAPIQALLQA